MHDKDTDGMHASLVQEAGTSQAPGGGSMQPDSNTLAACSPSGFAYGKTNDTIAKNATSYHGETMCKIILLPLIDFNQKSDNTISNPKEKPQCAIWKIQDHTQHPEKAIMQGMKHPDLASSALPPVDNTGAAPAFSCSRRHGRNACRTKSADCSRHKAGKTHPASMMALLPHGARPVTADFCTPIHLPPSMSQSQEIQALREEVDALKTILRSLLAKNQVTYQMAHALAASHPQPKVLQKSFDTLSIAVDESFKSSMISDEDWHLIRKIRKEMRSAI